MILIDIEKLRELLTRALLHERNCRWELTKGCIKELAESMYEEIEKSQEKKKDRIQIARNMRDAGATIPEIAAVTKASESTIFRILAKYKLEKKTINNNE